ncbi:MAG TPA: hypothetical protein VHY91_04930 [Pirellulales bacterium]|nr:hypothetical protein [Pirellulales bacterium]
MPVERFIGGPYHGTCQQIDGAPQDHISVHCGPPHPRAKVALYARDRRTGDQLFRGYGIKSECGLALDHAIFRAA